MFLTLEGVEGAGKSTLAAHLAARLECAGRVVLRTREPGGFPLGRDIRALLLDCGRAVTPRAELYLFLADRAQHVDEVIRPALARGEWVLCDRYADSTIAYQGGGRGMDEGWLQRLNDDAVGGLWPDITFLLDLPERTGLERAMRRNAESGLSEKEGRFEAETLAFHRKVRAAFLARAAEFPARFVTLDATRTPEELADAAWAELARRENGTGTLFPASCRA